MRRWRGVVLSVIGLLATLWLGATNRLGLYIHPRYFIFTTVMAIIALVLVVIAAAVARDHEHEGGHEDGRGHGHEHGRGRAREALAGVAGIVVIVLAVGGLLVLPPATLTTATASAREVNSGSALTSAPAGDYADYSVKDWAALLASGASQQSLAGTTADVSGFVTPDPDDPENVFYIARFVITCCAVDAQPVGIPVYLPGWRQVYDVDSWVQASGQFVANASVTSAESLVLRPATITPINEPAMPYVY